MYVWMYGHMNQLFMYYSSTALPDPIRTEVPMGMGNTVVNYQWNETPDTAAIESSKESSNESSSSWRIDEMVILQCNIDDMTAEGIAYMLEAFISRHGARDAWVYHTTNLLYTALYVLTHKRFCGCRSKV